MVEGEHIEEEEKWFTLVNSKLSLEERAHLEEKILSAKANAPVRPHPKAPQRPGAGASIVHSVTGAVEHALGKQRARSRRKITFLPFPMLRLIFTFETCYCT